MTITTARTRLPSGRVRIDVDGEHDGRRITRALFFKPQGAADVDARERDMVGDVECVLRARKGGR